MADIDQKIKIDLPPDKRILDFVRHQDDPQILEGLLKIPDIRNRLLAALREEGTHADSIEANTDDLIAQARARIGEIAAAAAAADESTIEDGETDEVNEYELQMEAGGEEENDPDYAYECLIERLDTTIKYLKYLRGLEYLETTELIDSYTRHAKAMEILLKSLDYDFSLEDKVAQFRDEELWLCKETVNIFVDWLKIDKDFKEKYMTDKRPKYDVVAHYIECLRDGRYYDKRIYERPRPGLLKLRSIESIYDLLVRAAEENEWGDDFSNFLSFITETIERIHKLTNVSSTSANDEEEQQ